MIRQRIFALLPAACVMLAGCASPARDRGARSPQYDCVTDFESGKTASGQLADEQRHVQPAAFTSAVVTQETVPGVTQPEMPDQLPQPVGFHGSVGIDELLAVAIYSHPAIAAARAKARALGARRPQVSALDDPALTTTTFLQEIQTAAGPQDFMMGLSQKFPWFGKRSLRGQVAYQEAAAALARLAEVELEVVQQVRLAYFDVYYLDRAIEINRSFQPRLRDVIEAERTAFRITLPGSGPDRVWQAEIELKKLQTTIVQLEQARIRELARLAQALSLPTSAVRSLRPMLIQARLPYDSAQLVAMLDACQPELAAHRYQINRDRAAVALAARSYYPDVTVGFNWYSIGSTGLSPVTNGQDAYSIMAGVNLPIYRRRLDAAMREARFNVANSARAYDATWNRLRAEVDSLHAELTEHDRVLEILGRQVFKARQLLTFREEQYRVSRVGFQEIIDDYDDVRQYEIELFRRRALREQAIAKLERKVGCAVAAWSAPLEATDQSISR